MSLLVIAVAISLSSSLVGCEGDSFGYSTRKLPAYDNGGVGKAAQQSNDQGSTPAPPSSSPSPGNPPAPQTTPAQTDAGSMGDAAPPPASAPGTCGKPKCAATGGLCGCKATDGAGHSVTMGCQGGACACFDANGNDTNDFASTCDDPVSAALAFQQCGCN